jgi:hypothetical protein
MTTVSLCSELSIKNTLVSCSLSLNESLNCLWNRIGKNPWKINEVPLLERFSCDWETYSTERVHSTTCRNIEMASHCSRASHPITTYSYGYGKIRGLATVGLTIWCISSHSYEIRAILRAISLMFPNISRAIKIGSVAWLFLSLTFFLMFIGGQPLLCDPSIPVRLFTRSVGRKQAELPQKTCRHCACAPQYTEWLIKVSLDVRGYRMGFYHMPPSLIPGEYNQLFWPHGLVWKLFKARLGSEISRWPPRDKSPYHSL